jgi:tyrosine-protein phosphatase SIW14
MKISLFSRLTSLASILVAVSAIGSPTNSYSATASNPNLPNFASVDPGIYRGAAPKPAGLTQLKAMGVTTVIDLRISPKRVAEERSEVQKLGMTFINLPMGSDPPTHKEEVALLAAFSTAATKPVYVHCEYGADRTGTMIGMYRRKHDHWSYAQTYKEMRHFGFKPWLTKMAAYVQNASPGN